MSEKQMSAQAEGQGAQAGGEGRAIAGMSRRTFALGSGAAVALLALGGVGAAVPAQAMVRPPGGQDEPRLQANCIRCERCVEACPKNALRPAHLEDGLVGVRMPTANFDLGWCDFCEESHDSHPQCAAACPTGALVLPEGATAQETIIGKAQIVRDWCLAFRLTGCRYCYDACPYDAIELDETNRPHVIAGNCNGCGACQSVCVSLSEGSIASGATSRAIIVVPEASFVEQD